MRLVPVQDEYVLGRPMRFRLEMTNRTSVKLLYDHQQVAVNHSLVITGPDGKRAPYVRGTCQTSIRGWPAIAPGQTVVLFDKLDAAEQYFIDTPGRYAVQFAGRGLNAGEPPEDVTYSRGRADFPDLDAWRAFSTQIRLDEATHPSNVLEIDVLATEPAPSNNRKIRSYGRQTGPGHTRPVTARYRADGDDG